MYSLQLHKPVVNISPVEKIEVVKSKPKKSEPIIENLDEIELWLEENDIQENEDSENNLGLEETQDIEEIEYYDPELYEEITFQDDFDKEYREDVWDSYFEDIEETIVLDIPEVTENSENILE